jgi:hypothetical protein
MGAFVFDLLLKMNGVHLCLIYKINGGHLSLINFILHAYVPQLVESCWDHLMKHMLIIICLSAVLTLFGMM